MMANLRNEEKAHMTAGFFILHREGEGKREREIKRKEEEEWSYAWSATLWG